MEAKLNIPPSDRRCQGKNVKEEWLLRNSGGFGLLMLSVGQVLGPLLHRLLGKLVGPS